MKTNKSKHPCWEPISQFLSISTPTQYTQYPINLNYQTYSNNKQGCYIKKWEQLSSNYAVNLQMKQDNERLNSNNQYNSKDESTQTASM